MLQLLRKETLLGIILDSELRFEEYVSFLCSQAAKKSYALDALLALFFWKKFQFNYCPLIWIFHSRTANNKINCMHERDLKLVYSDYLSSHLMNCLERIDDFQLTIVTFKVYPVKFTSSFTVFLQVLSKSFSF